MTDDSTYSGDVTLTGSERPPVEMEDPGDVFVTTDAVAGDLAVRNAEYVFTHNPLNSEASVGDAETTIAGDLEDGYVEAVAGDVRVGHAEDVFVAADAVSGSFSAPGAENVYDADAPDVDPDAFDVSTVGWQQSGSASDPTEGVYAVGMAHDIDLSGVRSDVDLYLVGHNHEVSVEGRSAHCSIHFVGYDNTVRLGPYVSSEVVTEAGFDNTVDAKPYPPEDIIEMSRSEAFSNAGFGRRKVTFQVPADADEEWCRNCGEAADAIIERHQMEAFFVLGTPLWTYDRSTDPARECEHCSPNTVRAELSPEERRDIFG